MLEIQEWSVAAAIREYGFRVPIIARLMEIDPKYVDVIIKRGQESTGKPSSDSMTS